MEDAFKPRSHGYMTDVPFLNQMNHNTAEALS